VWGFASAHFVGHSFGTFLVSWMLRYQPGHVERCTFVDPVCFMLLKAELPRMEAMLAEIAKMQGPGGFDFVVVCCSNLAAENFWQQRLEATVEEVTGSKATVLCVHEDWNGGAGNGLGTLYAFQKAAAKSAASGGPDLAKAMRDGSSVAIYHTAGKGTRMAPLPGAENNNKPGVKLPGLLKVGDDLVPITVLEAVLRQTSSYASVRPGRCSVFWGDQIFVPSCGIRACDAPADILAALRPMPTEEQWKEEALHQYGLIAVDPRGAATQLEKVLVEGHEIQEVRPDNHLNAVEMMLKYFVMTELFVCNFVNRCFFWEDKSPSWSWTPSTTWTVCWCLSRWTASCPHTPFGASPSRSSTAAAPCAGAARAARARAPRRGRSRPASTCCGWRTNHTRASSWTRRRTSGGRNQAPGVPHGGGEPVF
ncbi:unnamed protein product, partial [Prorocentrum cordatum]